MPLRSASFGRFLANEAVTAVLLLAAATPVDPGQQERLGCYGRALTGVLGGSVLAAAPGSLRVRYLGEHLPLCGIESDAEPPELPTGPWLDPTRS